jgi:hypothetical protein
VSPFWLLYRVNGQDWSGSNMAVLEPPEDFGAIARLVAVHTLAGPRPSGA